MMKIARYCDSLKREWNSYLLDCKNGYFMFHRSFMDYHRDRFCDYSLVVYDEKRNISALFPANSSEDAIYSHQGLTFGGLLYSNRLSTAEVVDIMAGIVNFYRQDRYKVLYYKALPWIYHLLPAQEDIYALNLLKADLYKTEVSSSIINKKQLRLNKGKKWAINRAKKAGVAICIEDDYTNFWELLSTVLWENHEKRPVHTLSEISQLARSFPDNIKLVTARLDQVVHAGAVLFISDRVVHTQYMANSERGRDFGALDAVIEYVINSYIDERGEC